MTSSRRLVLASVVLLAAVGGGRAQSIAPPSCKITLSNVGPLDAIIPAPNGATGMHSYVVVSLDQGGYGTNFLEGTSGGYKLISANFSPPCNIGGTGYTQGDWNCNVSGPGPLKLHADQTWEFDQLYPLPGGGTGQRSAQATCSVDYTYTYHWDASAPNIKWEPDPAGGVLSSADTFQIIGTDDLSLRNIVVQSSPSYTGVGGWGSTAVGCDPGTVWPQGYCYAYPGSVTAATAPVSLAGMSGVVTLVATANDFSGHQTAQTRTFTVDGTPPAISFSAPPYVSRVGAVGAVAGTASDDIQVARVTLAVKDETTGKWWDGSGFTGGSEVDLDLGVAPGPSTSWSYAGLSSAKLPLDGATWTLTARAYDEVGHSAGAVSTLVIEPMVRVGLRKAWPVPPTSCNPNDPCCAASGPKVEGVDAPTGIHTYYENQGTLPPGSPALALDLTFMSSAPVDSVWGRGWVNINDKRLTLLSGNAFQYMDGGGAEADFFPPKGGGDVYTSPVQLYSTMTVTQRDASGNPTQAALRQPDGTTTTFVVWPGSTTFLPSQLVDRNGNTVTWGRDYATGNVTKLTDVHGRSISFTYLNGRVSEADDSAGRKVTYQYDAQGFKTSETGPDGTTSFAYDTSTLRLSQITYPNGGTRAVQYDAQGRVLGDTSGSGEDADSYVYYASATVVTDAGGRQTRYDVMRENGLTVPTVITDPLGKTVSLGYDARMDMTSQVDDRLASPRTTTYKYDGNGNLTDVFAPANVHTQTAFDPTYNEPTSVTDPDGVQTSMSLDPANGNMLSVTADAGGTPLTTHLQYNDPGGTGHVSAITDPGNLTTQFGYDTNGQLDSVTDPLGRQTQINRDAAGRVIVEQTPNRQFPGMFDHTLFTYDPNTGDLTDVTDNMNGDTHYDYVAGRESRLLAKVTDARQYAAHGPGTTFGYDGQGLGRLTSVTPPVGGQKQFSYNADGTLHTATNGRGVQTTYGYDAKGRLTSRANADGSYAFGYDGADRVTSLTSPSGAQEARSYDDLDRMTQSVQTIPGAGSFTIGYGYDANGNRTSMTTPWGNFTYVPDHLNRVQSITDPNGTSFQFVYDASGRRTRLLRSGGPQGVNTDYAYDDAGELVGSTTTLAGSGVIIASAAYAYDAAGNRTAMTDWFGTSAYGYDDLNRLTFAAHPADPYVQAATETFTYDAVGNRTSDQSGAVYSYDAANELKGDGTYTYAPDLDGNVVSRTDQYGEAVGLSYDNENELTNVLLPVGMGSVSFAYDASGRRITKTVSGPQGTKTLHYVYDNEKLLAIVDQAGSLVALFTNGPGIDEPLKMHDVSKGQDFYYYADGLGSIRALSDTSGNVVERVDYSAYGVPTFLDTRAAIPVTSTGSWTDSPFGFAARPWDSEVGIYDSRYRMLDPSVGRFLQRDEAGTVNGFLYARANPLRYVDPLGLWAAGVSFDVSTINPFTSGGGGSYGINFEYTSDNGLQTYVYGTPARLQSQGFLPSIGAQFNWATGNGEWTGQFESNTYNLGLLNGFLSGGNFWTALGQSGPGDVLPRNQAGLSCALGC